MCDIWSDLWALAFLLYFRGFFERVQSNPYYLHLHGIVCRLWTFNVSPLIGIIRLTLSWLSAVHGPSRKLMSTLGVGSGCVTLPRGDRSSVPRGGPRPATRSMRRPVGTRETTQHVADGIIRSIARTSAVRAQHRRAWDADVLFSWREKLRRVGSLKLLQIFGRDTELKL